MSHLPPSQAAIFSPSVARAAASAAKDWSYVDGWLRSKYAAHPSINRGRVPTFERNPETLKVLLALAAANEAADEEREQLFRVEEAALNEVRVAEQEREGRRQQQQQNQQHSGAAVPDGAILTSDLLTALEANLNKEGLAALSAMSSMSVSLNITDPSPSSLSAAFVSLQARAIELEDALERVNLLQRYVDREAARLDAFLEELRHGEAYRLAPDLAKQNLELQRRVKSMATKLPELRGQVVALEKATGLPGLTVEDVKADEEAYLELLAAKKDLDAQVRVFAGLPPDIEAARAELEALRAELREATEQRDMNFEKLVERESPVKSRRRP